MNFSVIGVDAGVGAGVVDVVDGFLSVVFSAEVEDVAVEGAAVEGAVVEVVGVAGLGLELGVFVALGIVGVAGVALVAGVVVAESLDF